MLVNFRHECISRCLVDATSLAVLHKTSSLFSRLIGHQTVFFSHNKSAVSSFQPAYKFSRTGIFCYVYKWHWHSPPALTPPSSSQRARPTKTQQAAPFLPLPPQSSSPESQKDIAGDGEARRLLGRVLLQVGRVEVLPGLPRHRGRCRPLRRAPRRVRLRPPRLRLRRRGLADALRAVDDGLAGDVAGLQPHPDPGDPQPELGDEPQEHQAAGGVLQVRRPGFRPVRARREGREAPRREDPGVPPRRGGDEVRRDPRERRRGRVPEGERDGGLPGGGGGRRGGPVHRALHQVQGRGVVPAQAAARAARDGRLRRRRVPEGQVQARAAGEELLDRVRFVWTVGVCVCVVCWVAME
uniref:Uncharacterized protein n=1 Tax=Setaria viridis TaxID=4556 RepID=A0A4U6VNN7_SETVI|nr:hypothetical protein SEVIR_2G101150v2 [Setaria viridis]